MPIEFFSSIEEENLAEYRRRAQMTPMERMKEFAILHERLWGAKWKKEPMVKVIRYENEFGASPFLNTEKRLASMLYALSHNGKAYPIFGKAPLFSKKTTLVTGKGWKKTARPHAGNANRYGAV